MTRKVVVDVAPKIEAPKPRRIQTLGELHHDEFSRAAIVCAYTARDLLSMVERTAEGVFETYDGSKKWVDPSKELTSEASALLRSAVALVALVPDGWTERAKVAVKLLKRSASASDASNATLRIIESYDQVADRDAALRHIRILARATTAARKEAHRALSELLEAFPQDLLTTLEEELGHE